MRDLAKDSNQALNPRRQMKLMVAEAQTLAELK
jgi:hypothetical protein